MNTALWVIWFALLVAVGFTAFQFGGLFSRFGALFPLTRLLDRVRQEGWDAGFDRGFPHGIRADGGDPDCWCPGCGFENTSVGPCEVCGYDRETGQHDEDFLREQRNDRADDEPRWDDTVEDLMQRGRSYYEPLARGAGANLPPVTTAPCPGVEETMSLKGDSPGPGLPPSLIFDELVDEWRTASSSTPYETSAPLGSPPGGAEPEPPAPPMVPGEMPGQPSSSVHETGGAGADPWQDIAARLDEDPELNQWSINAERARCHEIVRELRELGTALKEPFRLTPWKGATA